MTAGRRPLWRAARVVRVVMMASIAVIGAGVFAAPSLAQDNSGKVSFSTGADFSHAYFFRGIAQERAGLVTQPYVDLTFNLFEGDQGLNSVSFNIGQWNSLHTGPTGSDGPAANVGAWYESDFYTGVGIGVDNWEFGLTYTSYLSPNDAFGTIKELSLALSMDDSALLGGFTLSPHVLMAIELDGQADGGAGEGVYFEFGVEPGFAFDAAEMSLAFPVTVGLSMSDYYESSPGNDEAFGYVSFGVVGSRPVPISEAYGSWEVSGGLHLLSLGDGLAALNQGDELQAVGIFGVSITY